MSSNPIQPKIPSLGMTEHLSGGLLIATPRLPDPRFNRMVVLMMQHDESGAFGIVLGPPAEVSIRDLCPSLGVSWQREDAPPVRYGGPCEPQRIFLLLGGESAPEETVTVAPGVHLGSSIPLLKRVGAQKEQSLAVFSGYAGWGSGQLESEIQKGSWIHGECWPGLLFDTAVREDGDMWAAALERIHLSPGMIISGHGVSA